MKVPNSILFKAEFVNSLRKIMKFDLDFSVAIQLAKTIKALDSERTIVGPLLSELTTRYNVLQLSQDTLALEDDSKKDEFLGKLESLMSTTFEIPLVQKLDLTGYKISTEDVLNVQEIIEGL